MKQHNIVIDFAGVSRVYTECVLASMWPRIESQRTDVRLITINVISLIKRIFTKYTQIHACAQIH